VHNRLTQTELVAGRFTYAHEEDGKRLRAIRLLRMRPADRVLPR
jgi:hypothetical protein